MHIGYQFLAPEGFESLPRGFRYYVAHVSKEGALVLWVAKSVGQRRRVCWLRMSRSVLAAELTSDHGVLVPCEPQLNLPEWLQSQAGLDMEALEEFRPGRPKRPYRELVEQRYREIAPAIERWPEVVLAPDPLRRIVRICRDWGVKRHPYDLCVWSFAYMMHGGNLWALMSCIEPIGTWDRSTARHAKKKFGRPSLSGRHHGFPSHLVVTQILRSFDRFCGLGVSMSNIYTRAMVVVFGCKTITDQSGRKILTHPDNKPFPTYGQFRYRVLKFYGLDYVQRRIFGQRRIREKSKFNDGNYSGLNLFLLEDSEIDAYFCKRRPRSSITGEPLPPLVVMRCVCVSSGLVLGVGFGLGSETQDSYRSMFLCAALPKAVVSRLYGVPLEQLNWCAQGLPPSILSDRGPGGHRGLVTCEYGSIPMKTITPSYSGQSKPFVEAGNPKSVSTSEGQSYELSDKTVAQMIKAELLRAVRDNNTKNVVDRLLDEELADFKQRGIPATPQNLWTYRSERFCTCALDIDPEVAVRRFAKRTELKVDKDGVILGTRRYTSAEFRDAAVQSRLAPGAGLTVTAYTVPLAVAIIWVDIKGRLYELSPLAKVRCSDDMFECGEHDLNDLSAIKRELASITREHAAAVRVQVEGDCHALTGSGLNDGKRRGGRVRRPTGLTAREVSITKGVSNRDAR